jgi:hypothetical protein
VSGMDNVALFGFRSEVVPDIVGFQCVCRMFPWLPFIVVSLNVKHCTFNLNLITTIDV